METSGILDPSNEEHMFALHYVFIPIINRKLNIFQQGYNQSPIRTEQNKTPEQLWIQGLHLHGRSDPRISHEFSNVVRK